MQVFHIETDITTCEFSGNNLKNVCRTCLEKRDHLTNMFLKHKKTHKTYAEMLMAFTPVNITENDEYSVNICAACAEIIESVYDFQQQCLQIDAILRFATVYTDDVKDEVNEDEQNQQASIKGENLQNDENNEYTITSNNDLIANGEDSDKNDKTDNVKNENYQCQLCLLNFPTENSLQEHLASEVHDVDEKEEMKEENIWESLEFVNTEEYIEDDENTTEAYNNLKLSTTHEQHETNAKTNILYVCEICGKKCSNNGNLKRHLKIHTGDKQYACEFCSKQFIQKSALIEHLCTHTNDVQYACTNCDKRFKTKRRLKRHEIKMHPNPMDSRCNYIDDEGTSKEYYYCKICLRTFNTLKGWQYHVELHKTNKYACFCGKQYNTVSGLHLHKQSSHTGERPFQCNECGKRFLQRIVLENHILTHTGIKPFQCSYCEKTFRQKAHVQSHELIHTGGKPFKCTYCSKQFRHQNTLIHHTRTHTGETPFRCPRCNKGFYHLSNMKKHLSNTKVRCTV